MVHYTLKCYKGRINTSEHTDKFKGSHFFFPLDSRNLFYFSGWKKESYKCSVDLGQLV